MRLLSPCFLLVLAFCITQIVGGVATRKPNQSEESSEESNEQTDAISDDDVQAFKKIDDLLDGRIVTICDGRRALAAAKRKPRKSQKSTSENRVRERRSLLGTIGKTMMMGSMMGGMGMHGGMMGGMGMHGGMMGGMGMHGGMMGGMSGGMGGYGGYSSYGMDPMMSGGMYGGMMGGMYGMTPGKMLKYQLGGIAVNTVGKLASNLVDRLTGTSNLQQKMTAYPGVSLPPPTSHVVSTMQYAQNQAAYATGDNGGASAGYADQQGGQLPNGDGMVNVGDGPFGKQMKGYIASDPAYNQANSYLQTGTGDINSISQAIDQQGGYVGGSGINGIYQQPPIDPSLGDPSAEVSASLARAQNMQVVSAQSQLSSGLAGLQTQAEMVSQMTEELKNLQQQKAALGDRIDAKLDETISRQTKMYEQAIEVLENSTNKLQSMKFFTDQRLSAAVGEIQNIGSKLVRMGEDFNQTYQEMSDKLSFTVVEMGNVKNWTERAMKRIEVHIDDSNNLISRSESSIKLIADNLASLSSNQVKASQLHNAIQSKLDSISEKLDLAADLADQAKERVLHVKSTLDDANSFLDNAAAKIDGMLLGLLTKQKRLMLIKSYNEVLQRLRYFQNEFQEKVQKTFSKMEGNYVGSSAEEWATTVIDGDASGMSMDEVLFHLNNMIQGNTVVFQRGSIMDWYMEAAQAIIQNDTRLPSEQWYIEKVTNYLVTLQITGYTLLSTAHLIQNDKYKSSETCVAMENELWKSDSFFAMYIKAASPKMRHPDLEKAKTSEVGVQLAKTELSYDWSSSSQGTGPQGTLISCGLCRGCEDLFPGNMLAIQCRFKSKDSNQRESIRKIPANPEQMRRTYRGPMNFTNNKEGKFQIKFVAGMMRVINSDQHAICGIFLSQRNNADAAASLGVQVCDRNTGQVIGTDDGKSNTNPIPKLVLRDGNADDGSQNERIETADTAMTEWTGLKSDGYVTEVGFNIARKRVTGKPDLRVLQIEMSSKL